MSVTIKDVARLAGVSVATVSRVLNASAPVQADTRARVLQVARELRFTPNGAARTLSRRRAGALGVILPDLYGEFFSELLRGIDQEAQRAGHSLLVSSSHHDSHGVAAAVRAMRGRVDGLLIMAPEVSAAALEEALPDGLAMVLLNPTPGAGIDSITVDNAGGARLVVEHLVALGHRHIAFITGPTRNADAQARLHGYRAAMSDAGVPVTRSLEARGAFTEQSGWQAARRILAQSGERATAIFAANDASAVGALAALRESGMSVPDDISVVGFDDIPIARYATPPLTTVRVAIDVLGARAASLLLSGLTGPARRFPRDARAEIVPAELVTRNSSGPPPPTSRPTHSVHVPASSSASHAFPLENLS
jgi:LacI family transcriptional regulator